MHKEGFCTKKWIKNGLNVGDKAMFFPRTRRTCPENPKSFQQRHPLSSPENSIFWLLKHAFFLSQQVTISYTNMFESKKLIKNIKQLK